MSIEKLYPSVSRETSDTRDDAFEPIELDDDPEMIEWHKEEKPLRWLFKKEGRGKLVEYAAEMISRGEPIYRNKSELAEQADVSRHSVIRHIESLIELGIYEELDGSATRYRPNSNSYVLRVVRAANSEIAEKVR